MPSVPPAPPSPEVRDSFWRSGLMWGVRQVLSIWNDVKVDETGIQHLKADGPITGALVLITGHTGTDDPAKSISFTWPSLRLIPAATEGMRFAPGLKQVMDVVHAFSVPDTTNPAGAGVEIARLVDQIVDALAAGHNVGWYPSGEILKDAVERLETHHLLDLVLKRMKERGASPKIIIAGQRGGNGSPLTRAGNGGARGDPAKVIVEELKGVLDNILHHPREILENGLVKARRQVTIKLEDRTEELLEAGSLQAQNQIIAGISNEPDLETGMPHQPRFYPTRYSDSRGVELLPPLVQTVETTGRQISSEARAQRAAKVREHLAKMVGLPVHDVSDSQLLTDLGLSSIEIGIGVLTFVNKEFGRSFASVDAFGLRPTVGDVIKAAAGEISETNGIEFKPVSEAWNAQRAKGVKARLPVGAKDLADGLIRAVKADPNRIFAADEIQGEVSYAKLAGIVAMLADRFERLPGKNVGLMVPTSVIGIASYFACLFAGKTPVLFNPQWTDEQAKHAMDQTGVKKIIAPMAMIRALKGRRISADELALKDGLKTAEQIAAQPGETPYPSVEGRIHLIDDSARSFGLAEMVGATTKLGVPFGATGIQKLEQRKGQVPRTGVILCTSGSTGLPKAVRHPSSRIMSSVAAMAEAMDLKTNDVVLNLAPFFHLVGYMTSVASTLMGIQMNCIPDPRAAAMACKSGQRRGATLTVGPPSLLQAMARVAGPGGLSGLNRIVWGAERMLPEQLDDIQAAAPNVAIRAGYGSTEQNVTIIQRRALTKDEKEQLEKLGIDPLRVIGQPVSGLDWVLVDPEKQDRAVARGQRGLFAMRGVGTMTKDDGYLGNAAKKDTYFKIGRKIYHNSDDLMQSVHLEDPVHGPSDVLVFWGRLGRFSKIGGEMIGHEAIEAALAKVLPAAAEGPSVLVVPGEKEDAPPIAYVTSAVDTGGAPLTMKLIQSTLMKAFQDNPNYAVTEVRIVDQIELNGSQKVDLATYKKLARAPHEGAVLRVGGARA